MDYVDTVGSVYCLCMVGQACKGGDSGGYWEEFDDSSLVIIKIEDCNGVPAGNAYLDDCQKCVGGNTGQEACIGVGEVDPDDIDHDGDKFTVNLGDCNDFNEEIYPGATEICGDSIDQNCDGNDLACESKSLVGPTVLPLLLNEQG